MQVISPRIYQPNHVTRPQHQNYVLHSLRTVSGFFNVPQSYYKQGLWDGVYGLSSLFEKTRKSNHLQMKEQGQNFLLSYLKTLRGGPAGVWTCDLLHGSPVLYQLS